MALHCKLRENNRLVDDLRKRCQIDRDRVREGQDSMVETVVGMAVVTFAEVMVLWAELSAVVA